MKQFLRKLKLIEPFTTVLQIEKNEFIKRFKQHVDEEEIGGFYDMFDAFSRSKNDFKGNVGLDSFKISRRKRFFDSSLPLTAEGTYRQNGEELVIEAEINGFPKMMIVYCVFLLLFYPIGIISILLSTPQEDSMIAAIALPFLVVHAAFMFGMPYFMLRRSINKLKRELERELYFVTKPEPQRYKD